jgi:uncharacterized membrane protein YtjA (UPF0391 family)
MPDDDYRPTHGLPPDSRSTNVPPAWWSQLNRDDLPPGGGDPDDGRGHRRGRDEVAHAPDGRRPDRAAASWQRWLVNLALIAIAALLLIAGASETTSGAAAILIVLGIVTLLVAAAVQVVRGRHRG